MFNISLNKKLFWIVASLIIISNSLLTFYMYTQNKNLVKLRAASRADSLRDYFISMRYVYHHQFLNSSFDINETTVGFLPAHASTLISDKFAEISKDKITIRNVTDRYRNPKNKADKFELEAIEYFKQNPDKKVLIKQIKQNNKDIINYTSPLIIDKYCISCHGSKEEVFPSIVKMYDAGYDYKIGDIRGVTSIKIPLENLTSETMDGFYEITFLSWSSILLLLILIYFAIKNLTLKDVKQKIVLEQEVREKTAHLEYQKNELEIANINQKHLFSILRTVADCNQILITSKNIDELIDNTAHSMHSNTTFASVKISLFQNNQLTVKSSIGLDEDFNITPLEYDVFKNNRAVLLKSFDETLPDECREKVKKYNITEIYSLPLRKEHYAKEAIGVISICTTEIKGLSEEEREMIEELAGDVGFAINSFHQKDAINHLSFYDLLTNLPNQKLFEKHLTQALTNSNNSKNYGAVLFFDFDNFKNVNDLMGKEAGDFILTNTADRLILTLNKASIISRYASDKFLILLENISSSEDEAAIIAEEFANEILLLTKEPFSIKEQFFYLTSSIGIVLFFDHNVNIDTLLNQAEYALRTAKSDGKNIIRFYNESLQNMTKSRSSMLQHLKEALLENQFFVNYQKQVDSDSKVTGVEALLRWQHPVMGLISPAQFIPLAEESGIIKELGAYVLREAANQLIAWKNNEIKKEWRISVNVSPLQFRDIDFVTNIKNLISSTSMNPTKLRVELTESVLIKNQEDAMQKIKELSKLGISVSIDDFGTGYSSLVYLKHLKINELKIDQSFVFGLETNSSDKTIIKTIIAMGEEFGFEVIAEGVETKEQFDMLKSLGCKYFQGYLFAKPCMAYEL
ncbi:MAG: hypothetical protein A2513_04055 [Sulfurimonas sp. RIFOXYD12_FULL_33_39]|uniref:EAL domain-containing protein n=1 Tax=unclassified Sulfurimonas TaxID=2623549 RepID=UPI0008CA216D|nr:MULTISPECIES: EAL domain-containing protein [unclassified Sulfurimonas]OHE01356.1 MAG: hypothetical protein A3G74_08180 [Sulfurimonas sp. RIFCSPLOWO2_12_FULL_34_6]OHE09311.1 MAG: hypothetical protein A2513_04055 [Sulfurimonas sp. RIFOXYD12_FULL_33_39]OHE12906.1 MAG: hypothetical protein A2530_04750 [Sulfurimonas sp. RIFOXYD2_FULL_34_21]